MEEPIGGQLTAQALLPSTTEDNQNKKETEIQQQRESEDRHPTAKWPQVSSTLTPRSNASFLLDTNPPLYLSALPGIRNLEYLVQMDNNEHLNRLKRTLWLNLGDGHFQSTLS